MQKLIILLVCLACSGQGREVEVSILQPQGLDSRLGSPTALATLLLAFNPASVSLNAAGTNGLALQRRSHLVAMNAMSDDVDPLARALTRRAILSGAAAALLAAAPAFAAPKKDYITMDTYNDRFRQNLKDKETFRLFQIVAEAGPTYNKFSEIAEKKVKDVSKEALRWDKDYRQAAMVKAYERLEGESKEKGEAISNKVLAKLEAMDKLSKADKKEGIAELGKDVADLFNDFVDLAPKRFEKFGELKVGLQDL